MASFVKRHRTVKLLHLFRNYSSHAVVVSSALLVAATNVASGSNSGNVLFGYWDGETEKNKLAFSARTEAQQNRKENLALVPLSKASNAIDPQAKEEEEQEIIIQGESILASNAGNNALREPEEDGGVKMYTVKDGDTVSGIASKHNITVNTILWANDIENIDSIQPGDVIFILPVAGITHKVKNGDNIDNIAAKYKADKEKIIAFNDLPANGSLEEGKEIVIPDGQGESSYWDRGSASSTAIERRQYANSAGGTPEVSGWKDLTGKAGTGHRFPYGYCTWYVAQKRYVPWSGNAGTWLYRAKSLGYKTGKTPKAGAIVVTTEDRYYGHVAYVEKVSGGNITVSEMNYTGWAKTSRRTLPANSRVIKGYIY